MRLEPSELALLQITYKIENSDIIIVTAMVKGGKS